MVQEDPSREKLSQEREPNKSTRIHEVVSIQYETPLPPPGMMAQYERIMPGSADRIISMAEAQSSHRRELENRKLNSDIHNERLGQILAFVLALVGLVGGIWLTAIGKGLEGLTTFLATLAGLAAVFIYGRQSQTAERSNKLGRLLDAMESPASRREPSDRAS